MVTKNFDRSHRSHTSHATYGTNGTNGTDGTYATYYLSCLRNCQALSETITKAMAIRASNCG